MPGPRGRARGAGGGIAESPWQAQVEGLGRFYGWRGYHPPDNRPTARTGRVQRVARGFPDWIAIRGAEVIVAELKTDTGRLDPAQVEWLDAWREVGEAIARVTAGLQPVDGTPVVDVYVWRPRDFDEVHARLARGRRMVPAGFDPRL